jgi:cytochrome c-type biogenesis protein CcmH/NrfG
VAASLLTATVAHAQNESLAEALFRDGRAAMKAGKYEVACPKFAESYRLDPSIGTLFNLARCEEELGHFATSWTKYQRLLDTAPGGDERRAVARERVKALQDKLPWLIVSVKNPTRSRAVMVKLDGVTLGPASLDVEVPVDPGKHTITFSSQAASGSRSLELSPGEHQRVELDAEEAPAALVPSPNAARKAPEAEPSRPTSATDRAVPPSRGKPFRLAGYVAGGIGLASLVGAGIFTAVALGQRKSIESHCTGTECDPDGLAAAERGQTLLRLADVALVTGAVGVGVGSFFIWQSSRLDVAARFDGRTVTASARFVLP